MIFIKEPNWVNYPPVADHDNTNTFFADIVNHYSDTLNYPDKMTIAHETTHMINANIRNSNNNNAGFYVGNNQAIAFEEPKFSKNLIAQFVPQTLQGSSFEEYIVGMAEWNDSPLYIYDEWRAYINGAKAAVDLVEKNLYNDGWTNAVSNPLEFSVYACSLLLAINKYDPVYLTRIPEFLRYTNTSLRDSEDVYYRGCIMEQFKWDKQDQYLIALRASDTIKNVLTEYFNKVWL
jgi:hypothetical protein